MHALDLSCDRLDAWRSPISQNTGVEIIGLEHMRGDAVIGRKRTDISRHNIASDAFGEVRVEFLIEVLDLVAQVPVSQGTAFRDVECSPQMGGAGLMPRPRRPQIA